MCDSSNFSDSCVNLDEQPKFFETLTEKDQQYYNNLRQILCSTENKNCRGKRLENFSEVLASIRQFCIKGDQDDPKRCLVCGIAWLPVGLAINNRQFSLLVGKCKSSVNGSLQKLGFNSIQSRKESIALIAQAIPFLKNNYNEAREWTVRRFTTCLTPQPTVPYISPLPTYQVRYASPAPTMYNPIMPVNPNWNLYSTPMYVASPNYLPPQQVSIPQYPANSFEYNDMFALEPAFLYDNKYQQQQQQQPSY